MATAESQMNLASLQQKDPYIIKIVDTASQVALYSFSAEFKKWEKTEVEGTLFVYLRSAHPVNGFLILNRLGSNDLIEPINKDLEFHDDEPFLLYRNTEGVISAIWFYFKEERSRIGTLMTSLVKRAIEGNRTETDGGCHGDDAQHEVAGMGRPVDIMQMLSKAQHEYDKSKGGSRGPEPKPMIDNPNAGATKTSNLIKPQPVKAEQHSSGDGLASSNTSISLDVLFKQASERRGKTKEGTASLASDEPTETMSLNHTGKILSARGVFKGDNIEHLEPLSLQHSTARHHRVQTSLTTPPKQDSPNTALRKTLNLMPSNQTKEIKPISPGLSGTMASLGIQENSNLANKSSSFVTSDLDLSMSGFPPLPANHPGAEVLLTPQSFQTTPVPSGVSSHQVDSNLSPVLQAPSPSGLPLFPRYTGIRAEESREVGPWSESRQPSSSVMNPLTSEQMKQALLYLVQNDKEFIKTLHNAYVKSLNQGLPP